VSVNLSTRDLERPDFPETVAKLVELFDVPSHCLTLEITENAIMSDISQGMDIISHLSSMGMRFAVDDFGTGYSSLYNLKRLPVNELKIDKSFVMDMVNDESDSVIVKSTIDLAHNLGLKVVAEGVADKEIWDLLRILGCDGAQGFYMSEPLNISDLISMLHANDTFTG
jgi:EAL domain-containing protein (putative c-di-GMP-specific phosphodiesterase class I)